MSATWWVRGREWRRQGHLREREGIVHVDGTAWSSLARNRGEREREGGGEGLGPVLLSRREWLTCTVFCTYLSKIPLSLSASFAFV
jgi:hypothetical protein